MWPLLLSLAIAAGPNQHQVAQRLYDKASAAYAAGHYEQALRDFTAAYQIDPATSLLFNLAQCHRKLGRWTDALSYYRSYLSERPDAVNRAAVEALVEEMQTHARSAERPEGAPHSPMASTPATLSPSRPMVMATRPPIPAATLASTPSQAPAAAVHEAPARPAHSHWLGATLLAATAVCAGFAIFGAARGLEYGGLGASQQWPVQANYNNWANAAVVLGIATVAGATGAALSW